MLYMEEDIDQFPVKIIACEVMKQELLSIDAKTETEFEFVKMGLHNYPRKLNTELQSILDRSNNYSKIILGFGLCGGAVSDLKTGAVPVVLPRVHDCIPILMGSMSVYRNIAESAGTFYLSGGWMQGERTIRAEYDRVAEKFGKARADRVMKTMLANYRRFLYLKTGEPLENIHITEAVNLSEVLGLSFETLEGKRDFIDKIVNGPWEDSHFITIPPGSRIDEQLFLERGKKVPVRNYIGGFSANTEPSSRIQRNVFGENGS
jgi:hypothetical protein